MGLQYESLLRIFLISYTHLKISINTTLMDNHVGYKDNGLNYPNILFLFCNIKCSFSFMCHCLEFSVKEIMKTEH